MQKVKSLLKICLFVILFGQKNQMSATSKLFYHVKSRGSKIVSFIRRHPKKLMTGAFILILNENEKEKKLKLIEDEKSMHFEIKHSFHPVFGVDRKDLTNYERQILSNSNSYAQTMLEYMNLDYDLKVVPSFKNSINICTDLNTGLEERIISLDKETLNSKDEEIVKGVLAHELGHLKQYYEHRQVSYPDLEYNTFIGMPISVLFAKAITDRFKLKKNFL